MTADAVASDESTRQKSSRRLFWQDKLPAFAPPYRKRQLSVSGPKFNEKGKEHQKMDPKFNEKGKEHQKMDPKFNEKGK